MGFCEVSQFVALLVPHFRRVSFLSEFPKTVYVLENASNIKSAVFSRNILGKQWKHVGDYRGLPGHSASIITDLEHYW